MPALDVADDAVFGTQRALDVLARAVAERAQRQLERGRRHRRDRRVGRLRPVVPGR